MSRSPDLGSPHEIELSAGTLHYRERGQGPPLVFIHGLLVNGDLWRKVVPLLAGEYRCITPDLPLGAHAAAMHPDADLSVAGIARLIAEFLEALDLRDATLVANDTGGALTQVVMTEHSERVARVVLTPCDAFDNFLPPLFRPLQWLAHVPPALTAVLQLFRIPAVRHLPLGFGWLSRHGVDPEIEASWLHAALSKPGVRRDAYKLLRDISPSYTRQAAEKLPSFAGPVLLTWATDDRLFPASDAKRLAELLPEARLEWIEDSYTFVSEDQPEALAALMRDFLAKTG